MKTNVGTKLTTALLALALLLSLAACGTAPAAESPELTQLTLTPETVPAAPAAEAPAAPAAEAAPEIMGTLLLSVNPEIDLDFDKNGLVIELEGRNDDGKTVISENPNYHGRPVTEVVSELIQKIYADGYFDTPVGGQPRNIVVKLEDGSAYPDEAFLEELAQSVRDTVSSLGGQSNTMVVSPADLNEQGLIGTEKARELVLAQVGLTDATFYENHYDLDDNVYELEFVSNGIEYEYELDAVTGKVREADWETHDPYDDWDDRYDDDPYDDWDDRYDDDPYDDWDDRYDDPYDDWDDRYDDDWDDDWDDRYDDDWDDDWDDRYDDDWDDDWDD